MTSCPNCNAAETVAFYSVPNVPVHSVVMVRSRQAARDYPTGKIALHFCPGCSFVHNSAFDESLQDYRHDYESTQSHSPTFNAFHAALADEMIERFDLRGRRVIEIGCGQGEFLALLCEKGENSGLGFDPAFEASRGVTSSRVEVVKDYFTEQHGPVEADFVCCKMTLEHIPQTLDFVRGLHRVIAADSNPVVFFQVPALQRILVEAAFWDIYYEHCSYFSEASLVHLFAKSGFAVADCWTDYDEQYLLIEAQLSSPNASGQSLSTTPNEIGELVSAFPKRVNACIEAWRGFLQGCAERGEKVALWGGGSKAVAYLTTVRPGSLVDLVIDINPLKQGTYLAGTGHRCVTPDNIKEEAVDWIVVMNPIYLGEVRKTVEEMGCSAQILPVTTDPKVLRFLGEPLDA